MAHEEMYFSLMEALTIARDVDLAGITHAKEMYSSLHSARVQALKSLNNLTDLGRLEKCDGFFRLPGVKSEFKEHSRLLTEVLVEFLKLPFTVTVKRECPLPDVALRPDAIIMLRQDNRAIILTLEVCHEEKPDYLRMKVRALQSPEAKDRIAQVFGLTAIPRFFIVISGMEMDGTIPLNRFLEEVTK